MSGACEEIHNKPLNKFKKTKYSQVLMIYDDLNLQNDRPITKKLKESTQFKRKWTKEKPHLSLLDRRGCQAFNL